ncbi:hypothetical protein Apa02nite_069540 [Actinoplanes palleronii]|uniref:Uncharacterized protein n=1 Tax=Actinoplanes palleronii TaxID=113570 RepID=A0ABQ4BJK1_9ACTN|nr:hypothetical protein Apa02nite_069540 [Actinoplanes palleronii]
MIDAADLEATYAAVDWATKPVFDHDGVLVWVSGPDECRVERHRGGRDLRLDESGTNVLPRARGLEILRAPGAKYRWVHALDWRSGAGDYLDRDRVDAVMERGIDLEPWLSAESPVGLRHLSYLMWFHGGAMANGAGWPLDACTDEQIAAFSTAAAYFGLDQIVDLLGRLEPEDDAISEEYWDLSGAFGQDASPIYDAVRCKLVEAPGDWAEGSAIRSGRASPTATWRSSAPG